MMDLERCGRILIVIYGHLADTMAATPALRSLHAAIPGARLDVLGLRCARPILARSPHVDRILEWTDFRHKESRMARAEKVAVVAALAAKLRLSRYDATLVLHNGSRPMHALADAIGSPIRVGLAYGSGSLARRVPLSARPESAREENARILAAVGVCADGDPVELPTTSEEAAAAEALIGSQGRPLVGIHPGSDWSCQQWLPEGFAEVASRLQQKVSAAVVLTGSANEIPLQAEIAERMAHSPLSIAGKTSFGTLVEVIRRLDLLVCVSSAAASVAEAVGTPSVVLFGPEDARYTGVLDSSTRRVLQPGGPLTGGSWCELGRWGKLSGCNSPVCRGVAGLDRLTADEVVGAVLDLLGNAPVGGRTVV